VACRDGTPGKFCGGRILGGGDQRRPKYRREDHGCLAEWLSRSAKKMLQTPVPIYQGDFIVDHPEILD
jgi:hypothetical protein